MKHIEVEVKYSRRPGTGAQSDLHPSTMRGPQLAFGTPRVMRYATDARSVTHRPGQGSKVQSAVHDARGTSSEVTHSNSPWLCLDFTSWRRPRGPKSSASGIGITAVWHNRIGDVNVLYPGDDAFISALPDVLQRSTLYEVSIPTAKAISDLRQRHRYAGQGGIGLRTGASF